MMKNVGAQRPTKIPKRSAWARDSIDPSPLVIHHMKIDPRIETKPKIKHRFDSISRVLLESIMFPPLFISLPVAGNLPTSGLPCVAGFV
jgi:hypothetical protein